ncbi:MAG: flagellar basal-body MS-ring/collar protein FliF [Acidimicrobiia bacterium]
MADFDIGKLRGRTTSFIDGFTTGQKVMTVLAIAGLVLGAVWFQRWASEPTYAPAYSNLSSSDAGAVTDALTAQGISFKLSDGGTTVLVPKDQVYAARIKLSAKNLPAGGGSDGFALIDKQGITTSEFNQRIDYQRALQSELENTIKVMDGVGNASVIITTPKSDTFSTDNSKMTASVMITPAGGATLKGNQVQAITHLVASSVPGLAPENVTIADSTGKVLSIDGGTGAQDGQSETSAFETKTASQVSAMLTPVAGAEASVVRVNATLNFDQKASTSKQYQLPTPTTTPGQTATSVPPLEQTTKSETYSNTGGTGGAAGTLGGTAGATAGTGGNGSYSNTEDSTKNPWGEVVEETKTAPGSVTRMSVAVLLDSNKVTQDDVARIETMVSAAAGLDTTRGDTLQVTRLPFDKAAADTAKKQASAAEASASQDSLMKMVETAVSVILVVAILFFAFRMLKKSAKTRPTARVGIDIRRLEQEAAERIAQAEQEQYLKAIEGAGGPRLSLAGGDSKAAAAQANIADMIDRQPDDVALTIRSWMNDQKA